MSNKFSRRQFIGGLGAAAFLAASSTNRALGQQQSESPLYPPIDLSKFRQTIAPLQSSVTFGYAAITWGDDYAGAIKDIGALGFRGVQLRANVLSEFKDKPGALRQMLAHNKLAFVCFSSGGPRVDTGDDKAEINKHADNARFVRDAGGLCLQVTDGFDRRKQQPAADDYRKLGKLLTEIGKRSIDFGIPLGYHNHMNNLGESPADLERVMNEADTRFVRLLLDTAHYKQGGGDPAAAIKKYHNELLLLHIKDVENLTATKAANTSANASDTYRFVELGRGRVDLPMIFKALEDVKFRGWAIIELDSVSSNAQTPKEAAQISKRYVEETLKYKI